MNQQLRTVTKHALCLSALAFTLGNAQAAAITQWNYSTETTFTSAAWESSGSGTIISSPDELSWGSGGGNFQSPGSNSDNNRSALTIGNGITGERTGGGAVTGTVGTYFGSLPDASFIELGNSITHWNNPITSTFKTLTGGSIIDTLTLTPISPSPQYDGTGNVSAPTLTFNFFFRETPNDGGDGGSGRCADGSLSSTPAGGCPDLFGFPITTLNNSFDFYDEVDQITRTYFAHLFVFDENNDAFPLQQLLAGECGILNLGNACFGFRTAERASTTAKFGFAITTEKIDIPTHDAPEPGSLALMGLGLAGLGCLRRRRTR